MSREFDEEILYRILGAVEVLVETLNIGIPQTEIRGFNPKSVEITLNVDPKEEIHYILTRNEKILYPFFIRTYMIVEDEKTHATHGRILNNFNLISRLSKADYKNILEGTINRYQELYTEQKYSIPKLDMSFFKNRHYYGLGQALKDTIFKVSLDNDAIKKLDGVFVEAGFKWPFHDDLYRRKAN